MCAILIFHDAADADASSAGNAVTTDLDTPNRADDGSADNRDFELYQAYTTVSDT